MDYFQVYLMNLDAHYVFYQHDEQLSVYGLAGLGFTFWKVTVPATNFGWVTSSEVTNNGTETDINLGIGANYKLKENLNLAPELRYTIIDNSYLRIGASVQYLF